MNKQGSTGGIILGAVVLVLIVGVMFFIGTYNSLVSTDESTAKSWGNVQTAYQRRADLIPNLIETVKGAKNFEQETMTKIAEMRSQAGQIQIDVSNAQDIASLQTASSQMTGVLSRLMAVVEAYPDLKSNTNFLALQDELAGTENRIKYERDLYNIAVQKYRTQVRVFPTNILAGMFGFNVDKWKTFEADVGAQKVPSVNFS